MATTLTSPDNQLIVILHSTALDPVQANINLDGPDWGWSASITNPPGTYQIICNKMNVFMNGQEIRTIIPPSVGGYNQQWPIAHIFTIDLFEPVSKLTFSPSVFVDDPGALNVTVLSIPGSSGTYIYLPMSSPSQNVNIMICPRSLFLSTFAPFEVANEVTGVYNVLQGGGYNLPAMTIFSMPSFASFCNATVANMPPYTDAYGRLIKPLDGLPSDVTVGTFNDFIEINLFEPMFYEKLQSIWQGSLPSSITWDENGYIKASIEGTYTLYPTTTKGHTILTVNVVNSQKEELTYYTFPNVPIDISNLPGFTNATNIAPHIQNGQITGLSSSLKFGTSAFIFNVIVVPVPFPTLNLTVATGFPYILSQLIATPGSRLPFPETAYTAISDLNPGTPSNSPFTWPTGSTSGTISVLGQIVANVIARSIDLNVSTIYASRKRNLNLFSFFNSANPNDKLIEVYNPESDRIISEPNGQISFGNVDTTSLSCKLILSGVEVIFDGSTGNQPAIPVIVIGDAAETHYVTSTYPFTVTIPSGQSIILVESTSGEHIVIDGPTDQREADFTMIPSGPNSIFTVKAKMECLLLFKDGTGSFLPREVHLIPFEALGSEPINLIKDSLNRATLEMPLGPTYQVSSDVTFATIDQFTYTGGARLFSTVGLSRIYLRAVNLDAGQSVHIINLIEGNKIPFGFINSRTIPNATPLDPNPPSWIVPGVNGITVNRTIATDISISFVAQDLTSLKYTQYLFKVLEPIKQFQILFFAPGMKYQELLPLGDFDYSSLDLSSTIVPGIVPFNYGELVGSITLRKYDGKITSREIYTDGLIDAQYLHTTNGSDLALPYTSNGITFTLITNPGPSYQIHVQLSKPGLDVGEYFFVAPDGTASLYNFRNVPALIHDDVYLINETQWITDIDVTGPSGSVSKGNPYSFSSGSTEMTLTMDFDATSPYYLTSFAFNVIDVTGRAVTTSFALTYTHVFSDPIVAYMTAPPNKLSYSGSASFKTTHFEVTLVNSKLTVNTIAAGTENLYIVTNSTNGTTTNILQLNAIPLPLPSTVTVEWYADELPTAPTLTGASNVVVTSLNPPSSQLQAGQNTISYDFYEAVGLTSTYTVKLYAKPATFVVDRIIKLNEPFTDDIVIQQYGATNDHVLISATSSSNTDLDVTLGSNGEIVMTGLTSSFPSAPSGYTVTVVVSSMPGTNLHPTILTSTIRVFVWDPNNVRKFIALSTPSTSSTTIDMTSITGELVNFNKDGQTLIGKKNGSLDWSNYSSGTVSIQSTSKLVQPYFLFTTMEVVYFVVIILPTYTTVQAIQFPSSPIASTQVTIDLLAQFYPDQEAALLDAGAPISLTTQLIDFVSGSNPISIPITVETTNGPLVISTIRYTCAYTAAPNPITQAPEFVIPINQPFTVTSSMIALNATLSSSDQSVRNTSDGFIVSYTTTGTYTVSALLTNGVSTLTIVITFDAYDPADTEIIAKQSFTGVWNQASSNAITFSSDIMSYSVDGVSYGTQPSKYVSLPLVQPSSDLQVSLTTDRTEIVVVVKLQKGGVGIFRGTYNVVTSSTSKNYLVKGETATVLTAFDLSDIDPSTPSVTLLYAPQPAPILDPLGYRILNDAGSIVGWMQLNGLNASFTANESGIWDLTGLEVDIPGSGSFPIIPYIETLSSILVQTTPVLVDTGFSVSINADDYLVSGIGQVIYTNWMISFNNGPSSAPISPFSISGNLINSTAINTAGKYTITSLIESIKHHSLTANFSLELHVSDPGSAVDQTVVLVDQFETSIQLDSQPKFVNNLPIIGSTLLIDNIRIIFGPAPDYVLTFVTKVTLTDPVSIKVTSDSSVAYYLSINQVRSEKDINVLSFGYNGSLFKNTTTSIVTSYISSATGSTVFYPGHTYNIGTNPVAIVSVAADGTFQISNAANLTLTFTYRFAGGTSDQLITLKVGTGSHPTVTINQSPPPNVSLGTNVTRVLIEGTPMSLDVPYTAFSYATFTWSGNTLKIEGVNSEFEPTLIQAENQLVSLGVVNVVSMLIDIARDVATQPVFVVPLNSSLQFILSFEPSRVTYNTQTLNGANQLINLYTEKGNQFATVGLSGNALTVTSSSIVAFSQPIGLMDSKGQFTYIIVKTEDPSSIISTTVKINDVIQSPAGITFDTIGTLDGSSTAIPGNTLDSKVYISPIVSGANFLQVTASMLTSSFQFYATLSDGSVRFYTLKFVSKDLFTSDLTKIPIRSFLGSTVGSPVFSNAGVTTVGNFVNNPSSLRVLTLISPFYGQFTLSIL